MTKAEKNAYIAKPSAAYYSGFGGIEIKEIEYGIDDHVVFLANAWVKHDHKDVHRAKIHYGIGDKCFFMFNKTRIYFDECLRI